MNTINLTLRILIPYSLEDSSNCMLFLKILKEHLPEAFPDNIGNWEPIKTPFTTVENTFEYWKDPFYWTRQKRLRCEGGVYLGEGFQHSIVTIWARAKHFPTAHFVDFLCTICSYFKSDIGYIYSLVTRESEIFDYDLWYPLSLGLAPHRLRKGIPLLPWATVFGAPYVNLLGMDAFLDVPAHTVTPLNDQQVYIQITEHIEDIYTDYDGFARKRAQIMDHLSPLFQGSEFGVQVPPEILQPINERR